jgi:WD40 repeat protein
LFSINGAELTEQAVLEGNRGSITVLAYSPKGDMLAVGDTNRAILVYDTLTNEVNIIIT